MSLKVTHFETLRTQFSWDEMKAHVATKEGGGLRVVEEGGVAVIRYEKGQGADYFRSVVWDTVHNRPLCVAPFRASAGLPPLNAQLSATEDFVDGFMMNAWVSEGVLQVATRTKVGGDNKFYSAKTFAELFDECLAATHLKTREALAACLEELRVQEGATSAFASFVLQHPEHRIVSKPTSPTLSLVHTGYVTSTGLVHISERAVNWPATLARLQIPSYPTRTFTSEEEVEQLMTRTAVQRGWRWQGLVFKDGAGGRWRLRTPTYTLLRQLRGAESTPMERFFRLRQQKKVVDYLKHYSEERQLFWEFEQVLRQKTADVLAAYIDVHKAHAVKFMDLPEAIRPAVFVLHNLWRNELRPKNFSVRLQNVIAVVNEMRSFEKKRLMESAAYVPVSLTRGVTAEATAEATAESGVEWPVLPPVEV